MALTFITGSLLPATATVALLSAWAALDEVDRLASFRALPPGEDDDFFLSLSSADQAELLLILPFAERRVWMRVLDPDDAADVLQHVEDDDRRGELLKLLDTTARQEVQALLAYAEDDAGGLMSPRFARLRADMTVGEAMRYLRRQAQAQTGLETLYYAYVLDKEQRLQGVLSFRDLFASPDDRPVATVMNRDPVTVRVDLDQEEVARIIAAEDLVAVPVIDADGRMVGIVTVDDVVDVVQEEATEDIHKLGGLSALESPYLQTSLWDMIKARGGWLSVLFVGELLTATAMSNYQDEIAKAVVLALFVPLIISSGGNSGSQAATLVIRALALGEVQDGDWKRVFRREILAGAALGGILGLLGLLRVLLWRGLFGDFGDHAFLIGLTVSISLLGVVLWGTISGSMLPFLIRRMGFDPASASAPFVATLVDVAGLVIYFSVAQWLLGGVLL